MERVPPSTKRGPKLDKDAQDLKRKEQYGFANMAKEAQFRSTGQGEAKELNDRIRELTDMLEDRKNANKMLNTENQRLKKMVQDLQFQMLNKPTARGESAALKSMREMARQYKSKEEMTSAAAEKLVSELMEQNQQAMDEMQRLGEERDGLEAELHTTREALTSAEGEIESYQREQAALIAEKEQLIKESEEQDRQRQQEISELQAHVAALQQQIEEKDAAAAAARVAAEAALRQQKAALEVEAFDERQKATAELQQQVAHLQGLLDQAHESLRSLNQTQTLGPGWKLQELGLPPPPPQPPTTPAKPGAQAEANMDGAAAPPLGAERSATSVRITGSLGASVAGPTSVVAPVGLAASLPPGSNAVHLDHSGELDTASHQLPDPELVASPESGPRVPSVASSKARSVRAPDMGSVVKDPVPGEEVAELGLMAAEASGGMGAAEPSDAGGVPTRRPSRAPSVAGSTRRIVLDGNGASADGGGGVGGSAVAGDGAHSQASVRGRASRPASVATASEAGEQRGGSPRSRVSATSAAAAGTLAAGDAGRSGSAAGPAELEADAGPAPLSPAAPSGPRDNVMELLLHDAALHPGVIGLPAAEFWPLLRLACPGIGLVAVALAAPAGSSPLSLLHAYRIHYPDDQALLTAVSGGSARLMLHNLKPAVVGAFGCPRVVAAAAAPAGGAGAGGAAAGVADGTLERVVVVAARDEHNCPSLELFCMDEEGLPTQPFQTLTSPWRLQLPDAVPPPQPHEFCIDTHTLHRLQADAARTCGLFDTAGRVFIGRTDGHTYLVWRLADAEGRRKATFRAINRMVVTPADDPWAASAPLATAALPLTAALASPTLTHLELSNVRLLLGGQTVIRLYEPSDDIATKTLACRTPADEKLVATVRMTARLAREPEVSEQLLAALQPALQVGSGASSLPPLHWLSLFGAEELVLARLLEELRGAVAAAAGRIVALPVFEREPERDQKDRPQVEEAPELQELLLLQQQTVDTVRLKERQLVEGLATCRTIVAAAAAGHPHDTPLARARLEHVCVHVARCVAQMLAFYRQRLELYRLGAAAWHFITDGSPVAAMPATTTRPQATGLREVMRALGGMLTALAPPGICTAELLTAAAAAAGASGATPPLMLLLPPALAPAGGSESAAAAEAAALEAPQPQSAMTAAAPPPEALATASRGLQAALRAAVDAASAAAGEACEALRREVAAPGTDDVAALRKVQQRLAVLAAPVTAALVTEIAAVCQAAVAASLAEPETVAGLRQQLTAAVRGAAAAVAAAATAGSGPGRAAADPTVGFDMVAALMLQLKWQAGAAASGAVPQGSAWAASTGAEEGTRAAPQLNSALQSLQWLVGAMNRAAPAPVAGSPQSAGPWLRCAVRLRTQLSVLCTSWSVAAVAAAGQALLLCGQRHAAVKLALEVMGREVDRVLDATKATLESIRANRSFDAVLLEDSMPAIATALTGHASAAVSACFWLATQMVMTPLLLSGYPQQEYMQAAAAAAAAAAATAIREGQDPTAAAAAAATPVAAGSCYTPSVQVVSRVSFSLVTLGSVTRDPQPPPAEEGVSELSPLAQPLLSSWQPRGSVLYLDVARLNAAAAAAAAAGAAPDAAPPPDTAALPQLPAAVELLGWALRHGEVYYHEYFSGVAAAADTRGGPGRASSSSSVAGSVRSGGGDGAAALAVDPLAALTEVKMAAKMAHDADIAVLAGRMSEAGSMVKWLSQHGVLVLEAAELRLPGAVGGGSPTDGGDATAARELARTLVGLLATHKLQAEAARALTPHHSAQTTLMIPTTAPPSAAPSAAPTPRSGSRVATPRASLSGEAAAAAPAVAAAAPQPLPAPQPQPLAVLTHLTDVTIAKPALTACAELGHRVNLALQALQAAFATAPAVDPHSDMLARHVSRQLAQQVLLLEGLLIAPELVRARHPGTMPRPGSTAAVAAVRSWQAALTSPSNDGGGPGLPPGLSRQGSRMRPTLPSFTPKAGTTPRRLSLTGSPPGPPRPPLAVTPPIGLAAPPGSGPGMPPAADAYSTESEDEEVGVNRLVPPGQQPGMAVVQGPGGGLVLLPDEPDRDSDAASIASASTLGGRAAGGRRA